MVYTLRFLFSKCSLFHNSNLFVSCIINISYTGCTKTNEIIAAPNVLWQHHCMWCELSKYRNAPVSLACSVAYCAGLYLQVQGRLHWSQVTTTHCTIPHNSAGLICFVAVA